MTFTCNFFYSLSLSLSLSAERGKKMTLAEIRTSARPVSSPWTRVRPLGYRVIRSK